MFIDEIKVFARAGHGGAGCVAFQREAFRPKGGPSGGNGGKGGDVILEADHDINNLIAQFYKPRLIAENGRPGLGKQMTGKSGKDLIIKVPCGTLVWQLIPAIDPSYDPADFTEQEAIESADAPETDEPTDSPTDSIETDAECAKRVATDGGEQAIEIDLSAEDESSSGDGELEKELVADLTEHGQRFVLCKGGRGGLGNMNFATARRQVPRFAQPGESGDQGDYLLELQIMAEIGLVGFPNAGKSTLLTAISAARPKIAPYPFTTLHPQIGVVEYPDYFRLTVCDVPGIIEGAHNNVGLGHEFLRHIERCKVLVFLVDMAGTDGRNPWDDFAQLQEELRLHDEELAARPRIVVANKMDEEAAVENLKEFRKKSGEKNVLEISAAFDENLDEFRDFIRQRVEETS